MLATDGVGCSSTAASAGKTERAVYRSQLPNRGTRPNDYPSLTFRAAIEKASRQLADKSQHFGFEQIELRAKDACEIGQALGTLHFDKR